MKLFDWLFKKNRKAPLAPSRPRIISQLAPDSPQIMVESDDGESIMIMDRDNYDYLYGDLPEIPPRQHDLQSLFAEVTQVKAIAGGIFQGRAMGNEIIVDVMDKSDLNELFRALSINEDPATYCHCGCLGGPTLEFLVDTKTVATIGLQHGHSIRWTKWKHDARLKDGGHLTQWLIDHGVEPDFLDAHFRNNYGKSGLQPLGFRRTNRGFLTPAEQRFRLLESDRVNDGDVEEILEQCHSLLALNPDVGFGYAVRGLAFLKKGEFINCINDLSAAISSGLHEAELFFQRAIAYDNLGERHSALNDCTSALEIEPGFANAFNSRGVIHIKLEMWNEAMSDLTDAIRLSPQMTLAYVNRSAVHHHANNLEAAIADCNFVIKLEEEQGATPNVEIRPLAGMAYMNRSQCYRKMGNFVQAESDAIQGQTRLSETQASSDPAWKPIVMRLASDAP